MQPRLRTHSLTRAKAGPGREARVSQELRSTEFTGRFLRCRQVIKKTGSPAAIQIQTPGATFIGPAVVPVVGNIHLERRRLFALGQIIHRKMTKSSFSIDCMDRVGAMVGRSRRGRPGTIMSASGELGRPDDIGPVQHAPDKEDGSLDPTTGLNGPLITSQGQEVFALARPAGAFL